MPAGVGSDREPASRWRVIAKRRAKVGVSAMVILIYL